MKRPHTEQLARLIPGSELIILPNVSHFAIYQDAPQFNAAVIGFLANPKRVWRSGPKPPLLPVTQAQARSCGTTRINNDVTVVDEVKKEVGATITFFVKSGYKFVRVSTNVQKADGSRASGCRQIARCGTFFLRFVIFCKILLVVCVVRIS